MDELSSSKVLKPDGPFWGVLYQSSYSGDKVKLDKQFLEILHAHPGHIVTDFQNGFLVVVRYITKQ